jgi:antitoxin YefM
MANVELSKAQVRKAGQTLRILNQSRGKVATLVVMNLVEQMALKDVKNHLSEVVEKVEREHERVIITKHGRPAAVVVSLEDLESLEQTLDILCRPALIKQIRESLVELRDEGAQELSKDEALALIPRS